MAAPSFPAHCGLRSCHHGASGCPAPLLSESSGVGSPLAFAETRDLHLTPVANCRSLDSTVADALHAQQSQHPVPQPCTFARLVCVPRSVSHSTPSVQFGRGVCVGVGTSDPGPCELLPCLLMTVSRCSTLNSQATPKTGIATVLYTRASPRASSVCRGRDRPRRRAPGRAGLLGGHDSQMCRSSKREDAAGRGRARERQLNGRRGPRVVKCGRCMWSGRCWFIFCP